MKLNHFFTSGSDIKVEIKNEYYMKNETQVTCCMACPDDQLPNVWKLAQCHDYNYKVY